MKTYTHINNAELVRHVDNTPDATPLERELAQRLDEVSEEVKMVEETLREVEASASSMRAKLGLYE